MTFRDSYKQDKSYLSNQIALLKRLQRFVKAQKGVI